MSNTQDFVIKGGETWHPVVRWATDVLHTVPVTAITQAAPAVVTAANHALPPGWPCALVGVQGMTQINATRYPPRGEDWRTSLVVDTNTVALPDVSSALFTPYLTGGFLVYSTPAPLVGIQVTCTVWDNPNRTGTPLVTLEQGTGITVDTSAMQIIPFLQSEGLSWQQGYYTLVATDPVTGVVTELMDGVLTIE